MEETSQLSPEEIEATKAFLTETIRKGEVVSRLLNNKDFNEFIKLFSNDYVLNQLNLAANYNDEGKMKLGNNIVARAKLHEFISNAIEGLDEARDDLRELNSDLSSTDSEDGTGM